MSTDLEDIMQAINQLPLAEQRQLAQRLNARKRMTAAEKERARAIVTELAGSAQGLDKETIIQYAEDEEYCGY